MGDDTSSSSGEENEWFENENDDQNSPCLFCDKIFCSADAIFIHCEEIHQFSMERYFKKFRLDTFLYRKFINYIRSMHLPANAVECVDKEKFNDDKFLKPAVENDVLLMYDIDDFEESQMNGEFLEPMEMEQLKIAYKRSQETLEEFKNELNNTKCHLKNVRERVNIMMTTNLSDENGASSSQWKGSQDVQVPDDDDDGYFGCYSHFSIHHEMLTDTVRTKSYQDAIMKNSTLLQDKTVLDVGCGTGILSMFCASAGASSVCGIDQSEIIHLATDIAMENNLLEKITFVKGRLETTTLPHTQVDVLVSEWMGYFLLFECMLETVIYARDKYLSPNGLIFPDKFKIFLAGISDIDYYTKHVSLWDDVYGYKMTCMKKELLREGCIEVVKEENVVTSCCVVKNIDMYTCSVRDIEFISNFELQVVQDRPITSVIGYFDTLFDEHLNYKVKFSTSPSDPVTHWKQTLFILPEPIKKSIGEKLIGKIECKRQVTDSRSLIVTLILDDKKHIYRVQ